MFQTARAKLGSYQLQRASQPRACPRLHVAQPSSTASTVIDVPVESGTAPETAPESTGPTVVPAAVVLDASKPSGKHTGPAGADSTSTSSPPGPSEDAFAIKELVEELRSPEGFGKRGEVWFIAQAVCIVLIIAVPIPSFTGLIDLLGTLAISAGLVFCGYGLVSLGRNLSPMPAPRKVHQLVTTGMYGYVRHPLYGGVIMASLGLAALTRNEARFALAVLLWYILEQKVAYEEKALCERYPEYEEYRTKVRKFFPFLY